MKDTFQVTVRVEIQKMLQEGYGYTGERLTINEEFSLGAADWVRIAAILGQFHGLAAEIQAEEGSHA
jgi:hypothetical protein